MRPTHTRSIGITIALALVGTILLLPAAAGAEREGAVGVLAEELLSSYTRRAPQVRSRVALTDSGQAKVLLRTAEDEIALARWRAYLGDWTGAARSSVLANEALEKTNDVVLGRTAERHSLAVAVEDLEAMLRRARLAVDTTEFDPLSTSTLVLAEQARLDVDSLAREGSLQGARWRASHGRELALIAIEQAALAPITTMASVER
jgi:hypothetical protein